MNSMKTFTWCKRGIRYNFFSTSSLSKFSKIDLIKSGNSVLKVIVSFMDFQISAKIIVNLPTKCSLSV